MVIASHRLSSPEPKCDQIMVLERGKLVDICNHIARF